MGNICIFSTFGNTRDTKRNFSTLSSGYFSRRLQCKICVDFLFLVCFETWSSRGVRFKTINVDFFILVDEHCFATKVFLIIEILGKKWWKQKLGTAGAKSSYTIPNAGSRQNVRFSSFRRREKYVHGFKSIDYII